MKFSKCGNFILYVKYDELRRSNQVYKHIFGHNQESDELILTEEDE